MADYAKLPEVIDRPATDEELIALVAEGDEAAFELIVARFQAPALRATYRFLGNSHEAEDIAQEAFLRVYRNARLYKPVASFRTWFFVILGNLCRDAARKKTRIYEGDLPEDVLSEDDPTRSLERREKERAVQNALLKLAPNQRLALILCYYEGLSYMEAAQSLNLSVKALESLLVRAKRALRRELAGWMKNSSA
jgi:RNA polymerase sigma-70 factor (ECF subfamily)